MNTNKRGKKRNDVTQRVAAVWNGRLADLIRDKFGSQKAFAKAYKEKYGTGNQADVSRWVNVGNEAAKGEVIGFPSYDTMYRIAEFFGVTVGYLTGETDFESFEMERACDYLGLDESAGRAIERITKLKGVTRFERYEKVNYGKALCYLLSSARFEDFLGGICQYAEALHRRKNPVDYMNSPEILAIKPEVLDLALKYGDIGFGEEVDDPTEITDEVIEAIHLLSDAESKAYSQEITLEQNVKLAKFELQERYFGLIEEVIREDNLEQIQAHYYQTVSSVAELKRLIESALPE